MWRIARLSRVPPEWRRTLPRVEVGGEEALTLPGRNARHGGPSTGENRRVSHGQGRARQGVDARALLKPFRIAQQEWEQAGGGEGGRWAAAAWSKDAKALIEEFPRRLNRSGHNEVLADASKLAQEARTFLQEAAKAAEGLAGRGAVGRVVSPWGGAVCARAVPKGGPSKAEGTAPLRLALLNPGKLGFSTLGGGGGLLAWRPWSVAVAARDIGAQLVAVPGARVPEGCTLPRGYPFAYWGDRTGTWNSVGILVATDHLDRVGELEGKGEPRRRWHKISAEGGQSVLLCTIYGPLQEQSSFWRRTWDEIKEVSSNLGGERVKLMVVGDLDLNLRAAGAKRQAGCQAEVEDRMAELRHYGVDLRVLNEPGVLTFLGKGAGESAAWEPEPNNYEEPASPSQGKSTIDLFLGDAQSATVVTHSEQACRKWGCRSGTCHAVGLSDHAMVHAEIGDPAAPLRIGSTPAAGYGRVEWQTTPQERDEALTNLEPVPQWLAEAALRVA